MVESYLDHLQWSFNQWSDVICDTVLIGVKHARWCWSAVIICGSGHGMSHDVRDDVFIMVQELGSMSSSCSNLSVRTEGKGSAAWLTCDRLFMLVMSGELDCSCLL